MKADLELIRSAAIEAGELAMRRRAEGKVKVWSKPGGSPVTDVDLEVDALLRERLRGARPDYGWLSEESADDASRLEADQVFVVDPIDGTIAYIKDRPWFAISAAVVEAGRPVAGVVHVPALGETYEAALGGGARLNGAPIRPSAARTLEDCAMLGDPHTLTRPGWPPMRIERRNSLALRVALVAAGAFDAAVALSAKCDWDLAAADLIAEEAGAVVTDQHGHRLIYNRPSARQPGLVCATAALHPLIIERVSHIEAPA